VNRYAADETKRLPHWESQRSDNVKETTMATCSDLMTRNPVWCLASDVVGSVAQLMKQEAVGLLPVVDEQQAKRVIGVVSDRDLVLNVLGEGRRSAITVIGDVMTAKAVTCRADEALDAALSAMGQHQIRRIPIIDESGTLVGIIALADVALHVDDAAAATSEIVRRISKPTPVHPSMAVAE
jgi:CBS domain-containing protein